MGKIISITMNEKLCHDCGIPEGGIHSEGCDMERCPKCGGQLISCDCKDEDLEGLDRVPYISWPLVCARCGVLWPDMFMVSNEEWGKYIEIEERENILCRACYDTIKKLIDEGTK